MERRAPRIRDFTLLPTSHRRGTRRQSRELEAARQQKFWRDAIACQDAKMNRRFFFVSVFLCTSVPLRWSRGLGFGQAEV